MFDDKNGIIVVNPVGLKLPQGFLNQAFLVGRIHQNEIESLASLMKDPNGTDDILWNDFRNHCHSTLGKIAFDKPCGFSSSLDENDPFGSPA